MADGQSSGSVEGADAGGVQDERSLRGNSTVVRERRERAASHSRARAAVQAPASLLLRHQKGAQLHDQRRYVGHERVEVAFELRLVACAPQHACAGQSARARTRLQVGDRRAGGTRRGAQPRGVHAGRTHRRSACRLHAPRRHPTVSRRRTPKPPGAHRAPRSTGAARRPPALPRAPRRRQAQCQRGRFAARRAPTARSRRAPRARTRRTRWRGLPARGRRAGEAGGRVGAGCAEASARGVRGSVRRAPTCGWPARASERRRRSMPS
jgi:hypothetical protein